MIYKKINIKNENSQENAFLQLYMLDNSKELKNGSRRPCVIICPGGGYAFTSDREAEPVAVNFLAAGIHAAVLRYSVAPKHFPTALLELGNSVRHLLAHAEEYCIDPARIYLLGFSAGGHLAASYGCFRKKFDLPEIAGILLGYPVITTGKYAHEESIRNLLGENYDRDREKMSLELYADESHPPTFLWHTATDDTVPVENTLLYVSALRQHGVSVECHIYQNGGHGLSLANAFTQDARGFGLQPECRGWVVSAVEWINRGNQ